MIKRYLSTILVICMIASTVLSGCNANAIPPADGTGNVGADETKQAVSADDVKQAASTKKGSDKVLTDLPTSWDLTDIYADYDAFEADMNRADELLDEVGKFRGTLGSAKGIKDYLESPVNLEVKAIMDKADIYQEFLKALNATDPKARAATALYNKLEQKKKVAYAFFDTEIMEIPLEERQEIISDEMLAPYAYYLRKYTDKDYRVLSEEALTAETLMEDAVNSENTRKIFDNVELIRPTFTYPDGTKAVLTNAEYNKIMNNPDYDRDFRNEIYSLRNSMRQPYSNTYASLLEGEMRKNIAKAKLRGFDTALDHALFENDVDPAIYYRIIEFAHSLLPSFNEYYKARAESAGLDILSISDLKIPTSDYNPGKITYEDSVNLGRSAVSVWGDEYLETFDKIITKPHIDVYPADTKASGAFESPAGDVTTPYVLYNFDGMTSYTSTIVHEMGHAVYSEFSAKEQNSYNNHPGMFTQEVASTSNELMLRKKMINNASSDDEKLYWLGSEIDLFMSALITQCKYSEFEDYCYKVLENGGSLNGDDLSRKWLELSKLYYGDNVQVDDETGIDWARISHFYMDYYVYQYATSLTYAASICNLVDKKGQDEIDDYISFLKAGNSASPADCLRIANVDPMDDKTYEEAGAFIKELIEEYISTISNMNYVEKKVSVYRDSLTSDETVALRMVGDIPYIKIDDYYNGLIFTGAEKYPQQASLMKVTQSGSVYETTAYDGTKGVFDAEKDTFECENLDRYANPPYYALLLASERDPSAPFVRNSYVDYSGEVSPVKVDFKKYGIDLIGDGNELWVPLATLQSLFCSPYAYNVFYNGKAIYISDGMEQLQAVSAKDMDDDYYSFKDTVRSEEKIRFDYNNLCFYVDTCYGCPEISRLSTSITEVGLDKTLDRTIDGMDLPGVKKMLLSQDMKEYTGGLYLLFLALDDGGHTGFVNYGWVPKEDSAKWADAQIRLGIGNTEKTNYAAESVKGIATALEKAKQDGFDRLEIMAYDNGSEQAAYLEKGDTAMYVFEHFYCNRSAWTAYENGESSKMPEDSMGTFIKALEMAKANPNIKKFVVNLSMNYGGESGIATTISKLMCAQAYRHQYNDYTGQNETIHYDVDLNFDGVFDKKDDEVSYPFRFAVICGGMTYSSANYLTNMAKDNGICVLGEQSEGGAFSPQVTPEPEGQWLQLSGRYKLLDKNGKSVDFGVEPDYLLTEEKDGVIDYSHFFDFAKISSLIDKYYDM